MEFIPVIIIILVVLLISIRQVNEYERGILFFLGRFQRVLQPGWRIILPIIQSYQKVDIRTKAVDVPDQETVTKDNIPVRISAVIYYRINDAKKVILEVENFRWAVSQLAQTTMRSAAGQVTLDELLQKRDEISARIQTEIDEATNAWGIDVESVELKDVIIPENLKRTIAKAAEAEREKQAVIIKAEGDRMAAENIAAAAEMLATQPGAMHLRTLQAVNDLSSDQSNTTIWMLPVEMMSAVEAFKNFLEEGKK